MHGRWGVFGHVGGIGRELRIQMFASTLEMPTEYSIHLPPSNSSGFQLRTGNLRIIIRVLRAYGGPVRVETTQSPIFGIMRKAYIGAENSLGITLWTGGRLNSAVVVRVILYDSIFM